MIWYKAKIRFQQMNRETRDSKTVNENYLLKAVSFADVEQQLFELQESRLTEFNIVAIAIMNLTQVYLHEVFWNTEGDKEPDDWYKCKVQMITEDSKGEEKRTNEVYLITASSVPQGHGRIEDILRDSLIPFEILDVGLSDILGINDLNDASFKVDMINRIADLEPQIIEPVTKVPDNQLKVFGDEEVMSDGVQKAAKKFKKVMDKMAKEGTKVSIKGPDDEDFRPMN